MTSQTSVFLLAASAGIVGLVHSLAPGHWLPVVAMAKTRRWSWRNAVFGAALAASGHITISVALGIASIAVETQALLGYEEQIERYAGLMLASFGLLYAGISYVRHSSCHGHSHHGPDPKKSKAPYAFLFLLGFSPCIAVLPVFLAAAAKGILAVAAAMIAFSVGVLAALIGATLLVSAGLIKLDHPVLEHYGDVIVGAAVTLTGLFVFFSSHGH